MAGSAQHGSIYQVSWVCSVLSGNLHLQAHFNLFQQILKVRIFKDNCPPLLGFFQKVGGELFSLTREARKRAGRNNLMQQEGVRSDLRKNFQVTQV